MNGLESFLKINPESSFSIEEVVFFKKDKNVMGAYFLNGDFLVVDTYISALECSLPIYFLRINEDVLINKNLLREALYYSNQKIIVVMSDVNKTSFLVSNHYYDMMKLNLGSHKIDLQSEF